STPRSGAARQRSRGRAAGTPRAPRAAAGRRGGRRTRAARLARCGAPRARPSPSRPGESSSDRAARAGSPPPAAAPPPAGPGRPRPPAQALPREWPSHPARRGSPRPRAGRSPPARVPARRRARAPASASTAAARPGTADPSGSRRGARARAAQRVARRPRGRAGAGAPAPNRTTRSTWNWILSATHLADSVRSLNTRSSTNSSRMSGRGWAAFAGVSALWGIPYALIKVAVDDGLPPAFVAWSRVVLGAAVLLALARRAGVLHALRGRLRPLVAFAV